MFNKTENSLDTMQPEHQLLLLAARLHFDQETTKRFENIVSGTPSPSPITCGAAANPGRQAPPSPITHDLSPSCLDWNYILTSANRLGTAPLMHRHLQKEELAPLVPTHVLESLKTAYARQAMKNLRLYAQLTELLKVMNARNIPVILLKGSFLAKWVYEDIALRPMSDMDILVREGDKNNAKQALLDLGFHQEKTFNSDIHEEVFTPKRHMAPFVKKGAAPIEVHTNYLNLAIGGSAEMQNAWENAVPITLNNFTCYRLSNEDFLINLFEHLAKHVKVSGATLYWFTDLYEMINKYGTQTDWNRFHQKISNLGLQPQLSAVRNFMEDHWPMSIPDALKSHGASAVGAASRRDVVSANQFRSRDRQRNRPFNLQNSMKTSLEDALFLRKNKVKKELLDYVNNLQTAWEIDDWNKRLHFLGRYLFPTRENLVSRYQIKRSWALPLFYLIHPFVLARSGKSRGRCFIVDFPSRQARKSTMKQRLTPKFA